VGQRSSRRGPVLAIPDALSHRVRNTTRRREDPGNIPFLRQYSQRRTQSGHGEAPPGEKLDLARRRRPPRHPLAQRVCRSTSAMRTMSRICHGQCKRRQEALAGRGRPLVPVLPSGAEPLDAAPRKSRSRRSSLAAPPSPSRSPSPPQPSVVRRVARSSSCYSSSPLRLQIHYFLFVDFLFVEARGTRQLENSSPCADGSDRR
jgi:hypothetical protein